MASHTHDSKQDDPEPREGRDRRVRADAQRNLDALLHAAKAVFADSGVDAPVREIAEKAGVGIGTVYRHFPQRSDLIAAVFRREMDACADAAPILAAEHEPFEALAHWMQRYGTLVATKRGLATALHSGDAAFDGLPAHFERRLRPAFRMLFDAASATGQVRGDIRADDLLMAVANVCMSSHHGGPGYAERMISLLVDGLRYGAGPNRP
ncbi:MAG: TetR/AcrR family transcriptional regulator [Acidobacteriota bacterium]|nr:TetR/AcrR family transcriptional regulator [Acidobacteriota bacterium]